MKFRLFVILITVFSSISMLRAQYFDAGIGAGTSYYRGELYHNNSDAFFNSLHAAAGVFGRYNINHLFSARLGINYGRISGDDQYAEDEFNRSRNLSFRSELLEFSLRGEINIPGYDPYNYNQSISPFLFLGIAVYRFNPEAQYDGQWHELQPLGTEGQGIAQYSDREYNLTQISIPVGAGLKYALTDRITLGLEWGLRITTTDYLDDVSTSYVPYSELLAANGELAATLGNRSGEYLGTGPSEETGQRGNPSDNDKYGTLLFTASYNFLDTGLGGSRKRFGRKKKACPTN